MFSLLNVLIFCYTFTFLDLDLISQFNLEIRADMFPLFRIIYQEFCHICMLDSSGKTPGKFFS